MSLGTGTITRAGIRAVINNHAIIQYNSVDRPGEWGIFTGFSENVLIQYNTTSNAQTQHGIYVSNSADRPVIRGNTVFGNADSGIHMNGDISQGGDGIISGALVEDNVIYSNGAAGGSGINCDGVQDSVFRNNLLYDNHASGISLFQVDGGGPSINDQIINNTIVQASDARWALNITNCATGAVVFNNILYNNNPRRGSISVSADSLNGFVSNYNVTDGRLSEDGGDTVLTLAAWQSATGQDAHSIVSTPAALFVSILGNAYHLGASSPAIDAGTPSLAGHSAPTTDLEGNARPVGAGYDMGAFEFGGQHPIKPPAPIPPVSIVANPAASGLTTPAGGKPASTGPLARHRAKLLPRTLRTAVGA